MRTVATVAIVSVACGATSGVGCVDGVGAVAGATLSVADSAAQGKTSASQLTSAAMWGGAEGAFTGYFASSAVFPKYGGAMRSFSPKNIKGTISSGNKIMRIGKPGPGDFRVSVGPSLEYWKQLGPGSKILGYVGVHIKKSGVYVRFGNKFF